MTVAVLADSPALTTGFGLTTRYIAGALTKAGHEVACFGIKGRPGDTDESRFPYRIWPAQRGGHWTDTLPEFFTAVRPDVLLMNMDAYNAVECLDVCQVAGWDGPTVSYVCFDGLPVGAEYLDAQRSCAAVWATSENGAAYLRSNGVPVAGVAPPGVNRAVFKPAEARPDSKPASAAANTAVVGVFATNTERKQIARALVGFAKALPRLSGLDPTLYLHCRPQGFWDLRALATSLGIAERVQFPSQTDFDERRGVPTAPGHEPSTTGPDTPTHDVGRHSGLSYVERLSRCDVVVNVPHSGDVEQVILEAQACGVPVIHTDDEGVMSEALGDGGVRLLASDVGIGRLGQALHYVAPVTIADALSDVLLDPGKRARLRTAGFANVERYGWDVLESAACAMVEPYTDTGSRRCRTTLAR